MSREKFNMASVRQHWDEIHCPRVMYQDGVLMMMGRRIPVINAEDLESRLRRIRCNEDVIEAIVGELFGFVVATEAAVAEIELLESLV